jgi:hypothetical protein
MAELTYEKVDEKLDENINNNENINVNDDEFNENVDDGDGDDDDDDGTESVDVESVCSEEGSDYDGDQEDDNQEEAINNETCAIFTTTLGCTTWKYSKTKARSIFTVNQKICK